MQVLRNKGRLEVITQTFGRSESGRACGFGNFHQGVNIKRTCDNSIHPSGTQHMQNHPDYSSCLPAPHQASTQPPATLPSASPVYRSKIVRDLEQLPSTWEGCCTLRDVFLRSVGRLAHILCCIPSTLRLLLVPR